MWQSIIVGLILAGALVYVALHLVRVFRTGSCECPGCATGCCPAKSRETSCTCGPEYIERDGNGTGYAEGCCGEPGDEKAV